MSYIFCTIAIGEKYYNSSVDFAKKLNDVSTNHEFLIVTDQTIETIPNCTIIKIPENFTTFYPNGCFNYNLKYYPIKLASNIGKKTIIYLDADWMIGPKYDENKLNVFTEWFENSTYDFCFERPHGINGKHSWDTCFWRHKIEPYGLMDTDFYDNGHVCNEQFLVFKNNDKLQIFLDVWEKRNLFSLENNIWPFAEGLEIGMSSIDADMTFTWNAFHFLDSCFMFYCVSCDVPLIRF
jgi:hypothetical protein